MTCWFCGDRHIARQCPKRLVKDDGQANTAQEECSDIECSDTEAIQPRMGVMRSINAARSCAAKNMQVSKKLMYLEVIMNGKSTSAMIDSGPHTTLSRGKRQNGWP